MRSLFWRIFLWFWLAALLLAGAVAARPEPKLLVLNKVDATPKERLLAQAESLSETLAPATQREPTRMSSSEPARLATRRGISSG